MVSVSFLATPSQDAVQSPNNSFSPVEVDDLPIPPSPKRKLTEEQRKAKKRADKRARKKRIQKNRANMQGKQVHKVVAVLQKRRMSDGKVRKEQILVRYKGYTAKDDEWISKRDCPEEKLATFWHSNQPPKIFHETERNQWLLYQRIGDNMNLERFQKILVESKKYI